MIFFTYKNNEVEICKILRIVKAMGEILKTTQFCVLKIHNYNTFKFLTLT